MAVVIKNREALTKTPLRDDMLKLVEAAYAAIDTRAVLEDAVYLDGDTLTVGEQSYTLRSDQGVWVVGAGKCAIQGASALEDILGDRIAGGAVVDVSDTTHCLPLKNIQCFLGTHPEPTETNVDAAKHLVDVLKPLGEDDLVIALISGGGSTLLCLPDGHMTCTVEAAAFDELTDAGATIQELNTVRKHISLARGGLLAKAAYPAQVAGLIFSDVPGNDVSLISSGPTVKDETTVADAEAVLTKYRARALADVALMETPKDDAYFERVHNQLLVTNDRALAAMKTAAEGLGYATTIVTDTFTGEAREVVRDVAARLHDESPGTVLLYGGESTVTLGDHPGKGGRNQEMALAGLAHIADDECIVPFSSDGHDNTDVAGALCDSMTIAHAHAQAIDASEYLAAHRSYDFFSGTGDALITGYTGSNVSDLIIACKART